jgi:hypothetical protein
MLQGWHRRKADLIVMETLHHITDAASVGLQ